MTLLEVADLIEKAAQATGIERRWQVVSAFGSAIDALTQTYPTFQIENPSIASEILREAMNPELHDEIEGHIEHLLDQLRQAGRNQDLRAIVMHAAVRPTRTQALIDEGR